MGSCVTAPSEKPPNKAKSSKESYHGYDHTDHKNESRPDAEDSQYYFDQKLLLTSHIKEEKKSMSFDDLYPLQRIKYIFEQYITLTEQKEMFNGDHSIHSFINHTLGGDYNNIQLLNDYYYLLYNYDDQLEIISNYLIQTMPSKKSPLSPQRMDIFHRNYRDRSRQASQRRNTESPRYVYGIFKDDPKEINTIQLIDKIYCYLIYTFKMGYKLRANDYMDDGLQNIDDIKELEHNLENFGDYHVIRDNKIFEINAIIKEKADVAKDAYKNSTEFMKHKYYINMGSFDPFESKENHQTDKSYGRLQPNIQFHRGHSTTPSYMSTSLDMMIDRMTTGTQSIDYTMSSTHSSLKVLPAMGAFGDDSNKLSFGGQSTSIKPWTFSKKRSAATKQYYNDTMIVGYRYYYWDAFAKRTKKDENNPGYMVKEWYIKKRFVNLKEEVLNNRNCLGVEEYEIIKEKTENVKNTHYVKTIKNNHAYFTWDYGLVQYQPITVDHLMAVTVYCNFYVK